ncbi:ABC transporter ATP-binding protein [Schaalia sp. 19OD2882]|nr:ABC transporter ATP-binding protein [Schaalia sp. 19OD2882]
MRTIALACGASLALGIAYLFVGRAVDAALAGAPPHLTFAAALACVLVSALLARQVGRMCGRALVRHEHDTRHTLLAHVFTLGATQRTKERAGRLVNTMTDGVERRAMHTSSFVAPMTASLLTPLLVVALVALTLDWVSALVLAVSIPVVPATVLAFQRAFKPVSSRYRAASRALAAQELDAIQGLSTLARMNAGRRMGVVLARAAEDVRVRVMRYLAGNQVVLLVVDAIFSLGMIVAATALALWRHEAGALSAGQALALVLLSTIMLDPLDRIGQFFYIGMGGMAAGREMKRFLAEEPAAVDAPDVREPAPCPPGTAATIRFEDVHFAWNPKVPVLRGVDLALDGGQHVVVTGASGAGKSTMSALLQGHARPDSGRILLDGHDLRDVPLAWVRRQVGVVEQSTHLFTGTLRDNLLIARPDAEDAALLEALHRAHLDDLLTRLPDGLETPVGQRGLALSGGEAQRLALARAILADTPVMLLDEPTAHVDLTSEREILAALDDLTRGRTTLTISHRAATIAHGGRSVDLQEGVLR